MGLLPGRSDICLSVRRRVYSAAAAIPVSPPELRVLGKYDAERHLCYWPVGSAQPSQIHHYWFSNVALSSECAINR